ATLASLAQAGLQEEFMGLLRYARSVLYENAPSSAFSLLSNLFRKHTNSKGALASLLFVALDNFSGEADPDELFGAYRYAAYYSKPPRQQQLFSAYFELAKRRLEQKEDFGEDDLAVLSNQYYSAFELQAYRRALDIVVVSEAIADKLEEVNPVFELSLL